MYLNIILLIEYMKLRLDILKGFSLYFTFNSQVDLWENPSHSREHLIGQKKRIHDVISIISLFTWKRECKSADF